MKFIAALILTACVVLLPHITHGHERTLTILYTGSINGELEPCGCSPKTDFGGLARLSGFISENKKALSPYVLLDAGNFTDKDTPQGRLKADALLKSFSLIQYDAVAFSERENSFSEDFFPPLLREYKTPALFGRSHSIVLKRDAFNINVSASPAKYIDGNLNILLTSLPVSEASLIKGWDVIITSSGEKLDGPLTVNNTIIVAGYPQGEKLGILTLGIKSDGAVVLRHDWQLLGIDIREDARVRDILNDYDTKVAQLLRESERPSAANTYLGAAKCAECHQPFEESWKKTRHATAFKSLQQAGKSNDPECIVCHAVGFGEEGGFYSMDTTPGLANVQCEECHGLNREHISDFSRPMKPVTAAVCLKCHIRENSPDFDYPVYLKKITH